MVAPDGDSTKGATRDSLRRHNLSTVLGKVHREGAQSRSALTSSTGLNRSTIGALVAELVDLGLVLEEAPEATGNAGRPSPMVRARSDRVVVAAIDVGSKWLTVALGGIGGALILRRHREVDNDARPYEETLAELLEMLDDVAGELNTGERLFAIGVAAPGLVRTHDGFVHIAPNIDWHDKPLGQDIARHVGADVKVTVANEAHLGTRAEHLRGAGLGVDNMIYLSSEIGVGGGTIVDGQLQLGADGYSGEVGHIPVNTGDQATHCRCGSTGCLEAETGALALLHLMGNDETTHLAAEVMQVVADATAGDAQAQAALKEIGHRLGRGLAGMINLLNPRRVVLGGFFGEALDHLRPGIDAELTDHCLGPSLTGVEVVAAALHESSALLGAVEIAFEPLLADPGLVRAAVPIR